jgi:hypothetical protein
MYKTNSIIEKNFNNKLKIKVAVKDCFIVFKVLEQDSRFKNSLPIETTSAEKTPPKFCFKACNELIIVSITHVYLGANILHLASNIDSHIFNDNDIDRRFFLNNDERDQYLDLIFNGLDDWSLNAPQFKEVN